MALRVPRVVREQVSRRGTFAGLFFAVAVTLSAVFEPSAGRTLEVYGFALLAGLALDLWLYSVRLEGTAEEDAEKLTRLMEERDGALRSLGAAETQLAELQAESYGLTLERDELQARAKQPRATLEDVLHTLDGQNQILALVRKHRELQNQGFDQWPVTMIQLRDGDDVLIVAHVDEHADRLAGEIVCLMDAGSSIVTSGAITATAENQVTLTVELGSLPEHLQDPLIDTGSAYPAGHVLRLLGLAAVPYNTKSDTELELLSTSLRDSARRVSEALLGNQPNLIEEMEEEVE